MDRRSDRPKRSDRALFTIAADGRLSAWTVDGASLDGVR
jgi:hypothetical protein